MIKFMLLLYRTNMDFQPNNQDVIYHHISTFNSVKIIQGPKSKTDILKSRFIVKWGLFCHYYFLVAVLWNSLYEVQRNDHYSEEKQNKSERGINMTAKYIIVANTKMWNIKKNAVGLLWKTTEPN